MGDQLWVFGMGGAVVGGALGAPLLRSGVDRHRQWLGGLLVTFGLLATLAATRHGRLATGPLDLAAAHLIDLLGLVAMPGLVCWAAAVTGVHPLRHGGAGLLWTPLGAYVLLVVGREGAPVPFAWLLPIAVGFTALAADVWVRARRVGLAAGSAVRLVGGFVAMAATLNVAQAARAVWPDVVWLREAVPLTVLGGLLLFAAHAVRALATDPALGPEGDAARRPPRRAPRYDRSALDDERAADVLGALDRAMAAEQHFLRATLTLPSLARSLHVSPQALSEALNRVRGTTLNAYLTELRVEAAKRHLADAAQDTLSVQRIGELAGFGSRSAFYKAFVAATGLTPTAFRTQHQRNRGDEDRPHGVG